MNRVKVGLLGLGTVGGGTLNVLERNKDELKARTGCEIEVIIAAVRDLNGPRICDTNNIKLTTEPNDVVSHPEVDVVIELIGGTGLAKDLVEQAIENGKHIVTANKALIALHGNELFEKANNQGVALMYESAVAGGIPIIKAMREGLAANKIESLAGIINGTGNFILTKMRDEGTAFDEVLKEAQELGYAEADPTFDVEGIDAAHKLTILASTAFGIPLSFESVFTEGISALDLLDVDFAQELGYQIKHLGIAKQNDNEVELRVHPTLVPKTQLIANVNGVMNAVLVNGDAVGSTLHYGAGAGAEPTASAVIADLVDVVRMLGADAKHSVPYLGYRQDSLSNKKIRQQAEFESAYYLRVEVSDVPGVMSKLSTVLADLEVSIEALMQKEPQAGQDRVFVIFLTEQTVESRIDQAIDQIQQMSEVFEPIIKLRVEHLS